MVVLVAALLILFVVAVAWFRLSGEQKEQEASSVFQESVSRQNSMFEQAEPMRPGLIGQTDLTDVSGGTSSGEATREIQDGYYRHVAKAFLPEPKQGYFYEGWLVRPSPFNYFSTGDMVHNESGEWVLEWFGEYGQDYSAYTQVVITIEPDDNNPDPADHILEGSF